MLQGTKGRYYIHATEDLTARVARHNTGMVHSTKRLGLPLVLVASREFPTIAEALTEERRLKRWKNPQKAMAYLQE
ncbi:MAG: GIY-YIG nuclease family protein [Verrucomicrobia bacterium]|jgi:predicted GIY-YIG superfamily endonuclease|nr:MAG: GIY-YIG nuclease family protein [Verrucomicrobiota bacterium]